MPCSVLEGIRQHREASDRAGDDVLAEIVVRIGACRVAHQLLDQEFRVEDVDAHRGEHRVRLAGQGFRVVGLFLELDDAALFIDLHHAEAARLALRHPDAAHRHVHLVLDVRREHRPVVHLVDVVTGHDQDVARRVVADDVDVLVDRVGGAGVPRGLADPLLRGEQFEELVELAAQESPAFLDVADQRVRLVLGEHRDAADARIDAVGERKIDDAELAAEGHRGLGAPVGQRPQARAAPARQHQRQRFAGEPADVTRFGWVHNQGSGLATAGSYFNPARPRRKLRREANQSGAALSTFDIVACGRISSFPLRRPVQDHMTCTATASSCPSPACGRREAAGEGPGHTNRPLPGPLSHAAEGTRSGCYGNGSAD